MSVVSQSIVQHSQLHRAFDNAGGEIVAAQAIERGMSERGQYERRLNEMATDLAHNINNSLSPAALYSQSLLDHEASLSDEARNYLGIILRSIENVTHTVARMRECYRE